jgi:hypothetical protein
VFSCLRVAMTASLPCELREGKGSDVWRERERGTGRMGGGGEGRGGAGKASAKMSPPPPFLLGVPCPAEKKWMMRAEMARVWLLHAPR